MVYISYHVAPTYALKNSFLMFPDKKKTSIFALEKAVIELKRLHNSSTPYFSRKVLSTRSLSS